MNLFSLLVIVRRSLNLQDICHSLRHVGHYWVARHSRVEVGNFMPMTCSEVQIQVA